ncbi:MAG: tRNA-binding protein [Cyclobacteriaceae bacterium]|jgi:tRNA-binding protein|nr:tRNA-binding protein [Flammeovirgaceae bacterium]MCZ8023710.1 tRNA-binding protein [Cytophagales bacterium]MCZ8328528.1 tRNA-binding protein [Cyclobacteriaceae bacterium]
MAISWEDFEKIELRIGTIERAQVFEGAKKPAYQLWINFGELGIKKSSAQITTLYKAEDLPGKQVIAVTNFAPKQIGKFMSEVLVTGFADADGNIALAVPDLPVPNGSRLI